MNRSNADLPTLRQLLAIGLALAAAAAAGLATQAIQTNRKTGEVAVALTGGDPSKAPQLMRHYGCAGCHEISGVPGADGKVGGSLAGLKDRVYIGGVVTNSPANLVDWIVDPRRFSPNTAMPATGIRREEARDVAAYLYGQ